jgi:TonB family protein
VCGMKFAPLLTVAMLVAVCLRLTAQVASTSDAVLARASLAQLSAPVYPPLARQANITGDVVVRVSVDPNGTVESAVVESGHPMVALRVAAIESASRSRFECHNCKEGTVFYRLWYTFKIVKGEDCCNAHTMIPTVDTVMPPLTLDGQFVLSPDRHITVAAEQACICDAAFVVTKKLRSPKCLYLWKCSTR